MKVLFGPKMNEVGGEIMFCGVMDGKIDFWAEELCRVEKLKIERRNLKNPCSPQLETLDLKPDKLSG